MSDFKVKLNKKQHYETGATRDDVGGKGRFDLIPDFALTQLAKVYQKGGENHGDRNWEKGLPLSRLVDSAMRHLIQYKMSKYIPELCEENHPAHSLWNICALIHEEEMIARGSLPSELDDLPRYGKLKCHDEKFDSSIKSQKKPQIEISQEKSCCGKKCSDMVDNGVMPDYHPTHEQSGPTKCTHGACGSHQQLDPQEVNICNSMLQELKKNGGCGCGAQSKNGDGHYIEIKTNGDRVVTFKKNNKIVKTIIFHNK